MGQGRLSDSGFHKSIQGSKANIISTNFTPFFVHSVGSVECILTVTDGDQGLC
jgi:hypothetical protein